MLIELLGRRVGGDIGIGAGHLALLFRDAAGGEFILSAYTDSSLFFGDLYVETFEGNPWVPREFSTENHLPPELFARVPLDLGARGPDEVATLLAELALAINDREFSYSALSRNSNSVIGTLLDLVGFSANAPLPNPPDVGWLGFVAVDNLLAFEFEIQGSAGSDFIRGRELGQAFDGGQGDDTLDGGAGADTLRGGLGDDILDGGVGIDMGVCSGDQTSYTLTLSPTTTTLTDRSAGGDGTDQLTSIELLDFETEIPLFEGKPMNLDIFDGPTRLSAEEFGAIIELYIAYFNRAPDALGLYYWGTEFSNGFTLFQMATSFFAQPETRATYASVFDDEFNLDITDAVKVGQFVTAVYANVLGRTPDDPGFIYWTDQLENNPSVTPALFILSVISGAKFPTDPTPQTDADQAYLATKSDLGAYFAVINGMSDLMDASAAMALFDGTPDSVATTLAAIDGHYADALDPETRDFLMPLVGVIDDPFSVV